MGIEGYDRNATWARLTSGGDAAARRAGASARRRERDLRRRGVRGMVDRVLGRSGEHASWGKGACGEELVGDALRHLPSPWQVVHDVPLGGTEFNVDHVVVGPPGVYSLNTKNLSSKVWVATHHFMVGGGHPPYLRRAKAEARDVSRAIARATGRRLYVRPVLVVLAPKVTIKEPPRDVDVVRGPELVPWLASLPPRLDDATLATVARAIRHESTWNPRLPAPRVVDFAPAHRKVAADDAAILRRLPPPPQSQ